MNAKTILRFALLVLAPAVSQACLTIIPGSSTQTLPFRSNVKDVKVDYLHGGESFGSTRANETVEVPRRYVILRFSKPGYHAESRILPAATSVSSGRAFASCLLSIPTLFNGFLIDTLTGRLNSRSEKPIRVHLEQVERPDR